MHIISRKRLRGFWEENSDAKVPLDTWYHITKRATWKHLAEVQTDFPHADICGTCVVFNIGGNKYRLIAYINFRRQKTYVLHILTHKEYDKEKWKTDC